MQKQLNKHAFSIKVGGKPNRHSLDRREDKRNLIPQTQIYAAIDDDIKASFLQVLNKLTASNLSAFYLKDEIIIKQVCFQKYKPYTAC